MQMKRQRTNATPPSSIQILDESSFLSLLRMERKRIERSEQHFILMLIEPGNLLTEPGKQRCFERFWEALVRNIRETDLRGWYSQDSLLGIIFVDLEDSGNHRAPQALRQKVQCAIDTTLAPDLASEIKVSLHEFPETWDERGPRDPSNVAVARNSLHDLTHDADYKILKRVLDVLVSALALIVLSPVFVILAIAIKLTSKGPVLFRQERVGQYFKRFTFLKFRSMYVGSDDAIHKQYVARFISGEVNHPENEGDRVFKITQDPRVTRTGRFLRRTSLDELPQLINVLQGDMTLVGPRPCTAYEFERYKLWHRQRLLMVKPGITGLWQVTGRSSVEFDEMVRLDLAYVKARSLWLDLKILIKTPRVVIGGHGAY